MSTFQIRSKVDDYVVYQYEGVEKQAIGGPWSDESKFRHVQVPDNVDPSVAKFAIITQPVLDENGDPVLDDNGEPVTQNVEVIQVDNAKVVAMVAFLKNQKKKEIIDQCASAFRQILSKYPDGESNGFFMKRELAYKWQALTSGAKTAALTDPTYACLVLEAAESATKADVDALVTSILAKAQAYEAFYGACVRIKNASIDLVDAVASNATLENAKTALNAIQPGWPML